MGVTGVPGEEPAWARAWLYESLGCFETAGQEAGHLGFIHGPSIKSLHHV